LLLLLLLLLLPELADHASFGHSRVTQDRRWKPVTLMYNSLT
jgi:hypothetical protein